MLDVLEFYTDHQKRERELEEMATGGLAPGMSRSGSSATTGASTLSPYANDSPSAPRFNAGTGLAGSNERPSISRQDSSTSPSGVNGKSSTAIAAARAAELVNGAHVQHANTIGAGPQGRPGIPQMGSAPGASGSLQASRPAPQRPLLTAGRTAPQPPKQGGQDHTPSSQDLRMRAKAQGPNDRVEVRPPGIEYDSQQQGYGQPTSQRKDSREDDRDRHRPQMAPSKSSPATSVPASHPTQGAAGATVGPPPVKPLQTTKKLPKENVAVPAPSKEPPSGSVAAAAAALEKPKEKERRISTMTEGQIMEKLRSVVSPDDPKVLYSKIKKIGQG